MATLASAVVTLAVIAVCADHAHRRPVVYAIVLVLTFWIIAAFMGVAASRRVQGRASNGVPDGDWTRRAGLLDRARVVSALRTSPPVRVFLATLLGTVFLWIVNFAVSDESSVWLSLPLTSFLLMVSVVGEAGTARGAERLAAGLDITRIPAAALADVSSEDPLTVGGLLREQAALRYGPELVDAAASRCNTYQGSVRDLMDELASIRQS